MHVLLLYNQVSALSSADDLDILKQVVAVEDAITGAGNSTARLACTLNLQQVRDALQRNMPDVVFNLVESLGGTDRLMTLIPVFLESLGVRFTGASSMAMLTTTSKLDAKAKMISADLPTPAWITMDDTVWQGTRRGVEFPQSAIVKAVGEHASLGLTDDSVFACQEQNAQQVLQYVIRRSQDLNTPHFAEEFIDGREFNLSVLASENGPVVLPPAEIEFLGFPAGRPRIVGHNAKWNESTNEYHNTPRRFEFPHSDQPLLDELEALARRCWSTFGLRGYARVDFRVDSAGQPWILEINANPCLSPDAGFAAALVRAGIAFEAAIIRILDDCGRMP